MSAGALHVRSASGWLADLWQRHDAAVVTPVDLCSEGWSYVAGAWDDGRWVAGGRRIRCTDVTGIVSRLDAVYASELVTIRPAEREYVAAECSAFLLAFMTEAPVAVLNRPVPGSLAGPAWRAERWAAVAASRAGARVAPLTRRTGAPCGATAGGPDAIAVTVVGGKAAGPTGAGLVHVTTALAEAADVTVLTAQFRRGLDEPTFVAASATQPAVKGTTAHMNDYRQLPLGEDSDWGGVHANSGIHNRAAYLLMTSRRPDGHFLFQPMALAYVLHRALTMNLSRQSTFADSRAAVRLSVQTLFRAAPHDLDRAVAAVAEAFDAVGIADP